MKHYAFAINLKDDPEVIRQYDLYHQEVPAAVIKYARNLGIVKSRIFRIGSHLFMFIETTDDFQPSGGLIPTQQDDPQVRKWEGLTRALQEKLPEAGDHEWWARMQLVHEF
jgi:L-rhamnose mutarotase